jgi:protoporphyrinogen oxidase
MARQGLRGGSALDALHRAGFPGELVEAFFRPWFGGIFLERTLAVAAERAGSVVARFASGAAALPAGGMDAIPRQLAAGLPAGSIELGREVLAVRADGVVLADGAERAARAVVVATDPPAAQRLLPGLDVSPSLAVRAVHLAVPGALPFDGRWLVLDGDGDGPLTTLASPSAVAAGYAPPGQHLLTASVLGAGEEDPAPEVLAQLRAWFGPQVAGWRHLATHRIRHAQHRQHPGDRVAPGHVGGVFLAGDHTDEASLDGALRSGRAAAEAILRAG